MVIRKSPLNFSLAMRSECTILLFLLVIILEGKCQEVRLPHDDIEKLRFVNNRQMKVSNAIECSRDCTKYPGKKLCYYRFIAENFMTNSQGCDLCVPDANNPLHNNCQCVTGDGFERSVLTINRQIPGPTIRVCHGDLVVIDVTNNIEGQELSIHWHGILQKGTQYYDGVPFVTQCPIEQGVTFRYQWVAEQPGTHFWHSHAGIQEMNGIYGSIIVRQPEHKDPLSKLYDEDRAEHVIVISDWMHELAEDHFPGHRFNLTGQTPSTFLINGKGVPNTAPVNAAPIETFYIQPKKRYRFRLINAFGSVCPSALTIESHRMLVIATDGAPVVPVAVDSIVSFTGERYDFILDGDKIFGVYWMQLIGLGECADLQIIQIAKIVYAGTRNWNRIDRPFYQTRIPHNVVLNPFDDHCNADFSNDICIENLHSLYPVDPDILKEKPDYKFFLSFLFNFIDPNDMYRSNTYNNYLVAPGNRYVQSLINNISFVSPSSTMLSQLNEISEDKFCNLMDRKRCRNGCQCSHLIEIPINSVVELIVIDEAQVPNLSHPFHLHGHEFFVMNMLVPFGRQVRETVNGTLNVANIIRLDKKNKLPRNFDHPPAKDTLAVPRSGLIIIRFKATNPGFWLLHCHFQFHIAIGMNLVIRVGEEKHLPPIPPGFPRCGDFTPPMFPYVQSLHN